MFSGIIANLAPVLKIKKKGANFLVNIQKPKKFKCHIGDSISVNGVCSTIIKFDQKSFLVEYMPETLKLTTFSNLAAKQFVNLEQPLKLNDIISGHLVSGHIDTTASITNIIDQKNSKIIEFLIPDKFSHYIIYKGSVAINGVSLTTFNDRKNKFQVSLIPHTLKSTNLGLLKKGDKVNIEFDLLAKYLEKIWRKRK